MWAHIKLMTYNLRFALFVMEKFDEAEVETFWAHVVLMGSQDKVEL